MKKKIMTLVLAATLIMSLSVTFSFAGEALESTGDISTYSTGNVSFSTTRASDTKASASVAVNFTRVAEKYTVAIVLQKKTSSGWSTATEIRGCVHYYDGTSKSHVSTADSWTVTKGALYRIKCVSTDKYSSGSTYTSTTYSDPF